MFAEGTGAGMESDVRYYRRRAFEEMNAANRAVTQAARDRRLQLVDLYVRHLAEQGQPNPFQDRAPEHKRGFARQAELVS